MMPEEIHCIFSNVSTCSGTPYLCTLKVWIVSLFVVKIKDELLKCSDMEFPFVPCVCVLLTTRQLLHFSHTTPPDYPSAVPLLRCNLVLRFTDAIHEKRSGRIVNEVKSELDGLDSFDGS
jgi:hypothetical protein